MASRVMSYNEGQASSKAIIKDIRMEVRNSETAIRRRINKLEILQAKSQTRIVGLMITEEDNDFLIKFDDIQKNV